MLDPALPCVGGPGSTWIDRDSHTEAVFCFLALARATHKQPPTTRGFRQSLPNQKDGSLMPATQDRRSDTVSDQSRYVTLNNGVQMPILGFGVYQIPPDQTEQAATDALATGYRHLDTAEAYQNEEAVGRAIAT